jgi:DNA-binding CsgD family transcriptional regulator
MASVGARVADWIEIVVELLRDPLTAFPVEHISRHLVDSFDTEIASYDWRTPDGIADHTVLAPAGRLFAGMELPDALEVSRRALNEGRLIDHHPLIRWFAASRDSTAQTMGRVPASIRASSRSGELSEAMASFGLQVQMSIPVWLTGAEYVAFVLGRPGHDDFSREDLIVARRVQAALSVLYRQCFVLGGGPPATSAKHLPRFLTGRELAVLRLVADGQTATAIARRLATSPRTVHKHLENTYRKLAVHDRVSAVRVGEAMGLVPRPTNAIEDPTRPGFVRLSHDS